MHIIFHQLFVSFEVLNFWKFNFADLRVRECLAMCLIFQENLDSHAYNLVSYKVCSLSRFAMICNAALLLRLFMALCDEPHRGFLVPGHQFAACLGRTSSGGECRRF